MSAGGNSRPARLSRWFRNPPEDAVELVLWMGDGEGMEVCQRWPIARVQPDLAAEVEDAIQGYLEETRASCMGSLRFIDDRGETLGSQRLRCKYVGQEGELAEHMRMEGTAQSVLAQTQAHQQGLMRTLLELAQYTVKLGTERAAQGDERVAKLEQTIEDLRAENRELEDALLGKDAELAEAERSDSGEEIVKQGLQLMQGAVVRKLAGDNAPPAPPKAAPEPGDAGE